jgi:hypothetical protein
MDQVRGCPQYLINEYEEHCKLRLDTVTETNSCPQFVSNEYKEFCKLRLDNVTEANICSQFAINECERHCKSRLDTVTVNVDMGTTEKLRFLIDTGAEISIVKGTSLKLGLNYEPAKGINVKGISDALLYTEGTTLLNLFTLTHKTTHVYYIMGDNFDCQYDGILGQDFWKNKRVTVDYCNREISMDEVVLNFDDEPNGTTDMNHVLTLKSRAESIVRLATNTRGIGIVPRRELAPGVI